MSFYNMLLGMQPTAGVALAMLDVDPSDIPRFRDAYVTIENDSLIIVLLTRTGGGNRESYEEGNNYLTTLPGYLYDEDDVFDSTYANFVFEVPEEYRQLTKDLLAENSDPTTTVEKWQDLLAKLQVNKG